MDRFLTRGEAQMVHDEVRAATLKTTVGGVGAAASVLTLNEWVAVVTIIYFIVQIAYLIWKWRKEAKSK